MQGHLKEGSHVEQTAACRTTEEARAAGGKVKQEPGAIGGIGTQVRGASLACLCTGLQARRLTAPARLVLVPGRLHSTLCQAELGTCNAVCFGERTAVACHQVSLAHLP